MAASAEKNVSIAISSSVTSRGDPKTVGPPLAEVADLGGQAVGMPREAQHGDRRPGEFRGQPTEDDPHGVVASRSQRTFTATAAFGSTPLSGGISADRVLGTQSRRRSRSDP
ncbi:hypothetical protein Ade02nite_90250 [Paractinoplanes deccanensis]|uniref:Uncharacterized protein n=1 Tax=Paractinoplanes deccanensis TaxID=113561 RepID=A0ABQ3YK39_9ACTN|nr:hypothetical protein Ade02nite_90250 [Actinoplanes deccanensis]